MPQVLRSPLAQRDLDEIWEYIAQQSLPAADRMVDAIVAKCQLLATHSQMGQRRPELAPGLRSFTVGNYVVLYRPAANGIEVARVVHAARDVDALF